MIENNEIIRIYGTEFKENTKKLLVEADLADMIPSKKCRIAIKPNLVSASEASWGATTHTEILAGIIEYLQERGYNNLVIAEGSWVGDKTSVCFKVCGYDKLSRKYGVPLHCIFVKILFSILFKISFPLLMHSFFPEDCPERPIYGTMGK